MTRGDTDEELMVRYQAGDASALEALYRRHAASLMRFVTWLSRGGLTAEDVLQEIFLQIHRARRSYQPSRPAKPWLFGVAKHVIMDHLRRRGRSPRTQFEAEDQLGGEGFEGRVMARAELARGLVLLTDTQRQAFVLIRVLGMSVREAASVMETTEVTAKVRLHRAMTRLKHVLGDREGGHGLRDGVETNES